MSVEAIVTCSSCASLLAQLRAQGATDAAMRCDECGQPVALGTHARQRLERQVESRGQRSLFALLRDAALIAERDARDRPPPSGIVRPGWDGNTGGGARVESTDLTDEQCDAITRLREGARLRDRLNALRHAGEQEQRVFEVLVVLLAITRFAFEWRESVVVTFDAGSVSVRGYDEHHVFDRLSEAQRRFVAETRAIQRDAAVLATFTVLHHIVQAAALTPRPETVSPLLLASHAIELCVLHSRVWRGRLYEPNGKRFVDRPTLLRGIRDELTDLVATREQRASWRLPEKPKASAEHEQWKAQCDGARARKKRFAASLEELVLMVWFKNEVR